MPVSPQESVNDCHRALEAILAAMERVRGVLRHPAAVKEYWPELRDKIFVHCSRLDRRFFQALAGYFSDDRPAGKMLEFLEYDLNELKVALLEFDAKYTDRGRSADLRHFPKDFVDLARRIVDRVQVEEEYLLPLLARYVSGRGVSGRNRQPGSCGRRRESF